MKTYDMLLTMSIIKHGYASKITLGTGGIMLEFTMRVKG